MNIHVVENQYMYQLYILMEQMEARVNQAICLSCKMTCMPIQNLKISGIAIQGLALIGTHLIGLHKNEDVIDAHGQHEERNHLDDNE